MSSSLCLWFVCLVVAVGWNELSTVDLGYNHAVRLVLSSGRKISHVEA